MLDVAACQGCGACADACPKGAIALVDGKARIDATRCVGCGLCVASCPQKALTLVEAGAPSRPGAVAENHP